MLDTDGNLYLAVNQDNVSVSPDGKERWEIASPVPIEASPAVAVNDVIYFSAPWRSLAAVTGAGRRIWLINTCTNLNFGNIIASPVIARNGTIYIAEEDLLEAINSTNGLAPLAHSSWPMFRANPRHTGRVQVENNH